MLAPRWRKVLRDLSANKTRTILVLLSIAVGVMAIGMVMTSQKIIDESLPEAYAASKPSAGQLFSLATYGDRLVEAVENMPEVEGASGRRSVNVRFLTENGEWRNLQLVAVPDYEDMDINVIKSESGEFPPDERNVLLERASLTASLGLGDAEIGDTLHIETPSGKQRELTVSGTVHDITQLPAFMTGAGYGYVTFDTLAWLGEPRDYNQLLYTAANVTGDEAGEAKLLEYDYVTEVGKAIQDRMEASGIPIFFLFVGPPGEHPTQNFLDGFSLILGAIGILALGLSTFLIINTLNAIMAQQVRQIGIMKAIGARVYQVSFMYLVMVLAFGLLSLLIAIPLGALGGAALASMFAGLLNFDVAGFQIYPQVALIQAGIGLAIPLLAAIAPIVRGVRVTVHEAISEQGLGKGQFGTSAIDTFIVGLRRIFPMGRPAQISLRNTFRRKSRLAMTLITLSLASAIFIAIFSIRASLQQTLTDALAYFDYDVQIVFDRSYRVDRILKQLDHFPEVEQIETWGFGTTRRVRPDDSEGDSITIYAPRADTEMLNLQLLEGRWLEEDDANAVVINTDVLRNEDDLKLGDTITFNMSGDEMDWVIVGIVRGVLTGANAFVDFDYHARITNEVDRAQLALVRLRDRSPESQSEVGLRIEDEYRGSGYRVQQMQTIAQVRTMISTMFDVIIGFLLVMALLLGFVGGLGLMGTMSINVLERTREIGVMRAIGASNNAILRIVLMEGVVIGLISWTIGGLLAYPAGAFLTKTLGNVLLQSEPTYIFSVGGAILWLVIVLVLALLASFLPARRASRLTVREVLSYE